MTNGTTTPGGLTTMRTRTGHVHRVDQGRERDAYCRPFLTALATPSASVHCMGGTRPIHATARSTLTTTKRFKRSRHTLWGWRMPSGPAGVLEARRGPSTTTTTTTVALLVQHACYAAVRQFLISRPLQGPKQTSLEMSCSAESKRRWQRLSCCRNWRSSTLWNSR